MTAIENSLSTGCKSAGNMLVAILVIGSVWGLLDALTVIYISPMFHIRKLCMCPMTVVLYGFPLMTIAMVKYRKPLMMIGIGVIAALFKLLDFALISLPVIDGQPIYQPVVNPALAAITVSIVYAVFVGLLVKKLEKNTVSRILMGAIMGFLSVIAFVCTAFYITQTPPLIVLTPMELLFPFHGPATALLGAICLPLGYWIAVKLNQRTDLLQIKKPVLYYFLSGFILVFSILASTIILVSGAQN
ncbi:MAG: hypothetical protein D4R67_12800 [Bacteroidetes bacterium]|nr:MAG: hypothetical protein D4R67_12800 [Bacteroidota bacterium]